MLGHVRGCLASGATSADEIIESVEDTELKAGIRGLAIEDIKPHPSLQLDALVAELHEAELARSGEAERKRKIADKKTDAEKLN
jgi:hypothetical protein